MYNMEQQRRQDNDLLRLLSLILWYNNVIFGKKKVYILCNEPLIPTSQNLPLVEELRFIHTQ